MKDEYKDSCISAGMSLAGKKGSLFFRANVENLVSKDDLKVPNSELTRVMGIAGKDILACKIDDNISSCIIDDNGCRFVSATTNELINKNLREVL